MFGLHNYYVLIIVDICHFACYNSSYEDDFEPDDDDSPLTTPTSTPATTVTTATTNIATKKRQPGANNPDGDLYDFSTQNLGY